MNSRRLFQSIFRITLVLLIPILCVLTGYIVGAEISGAAHLPTTRQVKWESLDHLDERLVALLAADRDSIAAASASGKIYYWHSNSGWQEVNQLPTFAASDGEFDFPRVLPPSPAIATIQVSGLDESGIYIEYALLEDGNVWIWQYMQPGLGRLALGFKLE